MDAKGSTLRPDESAPLGLPFFKAPKGRFIKLLGERQMRYLKKRRAAPIAQMNRPLGPAIL